MRNKSTLLVLAALICIFGYFSWEHFSKTKSDKEEHGYRENEDEHEMEEMERKLERQDGMDMAMAFEFELTKDPSLNAVPRERLLAAENYRKQKIAGLAINRTATAVPGINWTERGPNNVGGRTRALLYDVNDAANGYKKVFAGSVGGGLWVTNDITAATPTWTRIDDFMGNLAVTTLAQDPSNTQNIYAGTGEGWFNADAIRGLGIWKSTNGGASWSQLSSTNNSTFYYVQKVVLTATGVLLAATRNGGVQRSTDGGTTWTKVLGNGTGGGTDNSAADLEIGANGYIYCSIGIFSTDGIWRSTDNGINWTKIYTSASDEERIELACAPSDQNKLYALVQDGTTNGIKKIMSTSDATNATPTWTTLTTPSWCDQGSVSTDFTRGQAWYDLIAVVDPANANNVFIGGVDILKTTDGGSTWSQVTQWAGGCSSLPSIHADNHVIVFKPGSSTEMLFGNDGGIYRTADGGSTFASRISGYNVTQYYACAIHPSTTNYFLAGAQDNGSQKFSSAGINSTSNASGGDGAFCHIDQTDGVTQITSYVYNNYYVSLTGGNTFIQRFFGNTGSFINPTDYDDNSNILYGGNSAGTYFRWNNAGAGGTSTDNVTVTNFSGASVRHVCVSPITANRVYFGLNNGSAVMVDNANTGTSLAGTVIKTGTGSVSCVAIDPANEDHMLVTYSNYGVTSIYESLNATQASPTWTAVEGNLPDMPVRWAMFDPRNSDWALIATDLGVWSTSDLNGASTDWDPTNTSLANVRVDMLQYRASDRTIAAATHGRGLFTAVVPVSTTPDISFAASTGSATEATGASSGCRSYTDYTINMQIANAPAGDATVTLAIQAGATATQGVDYDFTTNGSFSPKSNTLVFSNGATASKTITLRVYDDEEVESAQTFTLTYSISGTTDAQAGSSNQTYTFTINDNDAAPTAASSANYTVATYDVNAGAISPFQGANKKAKAQYIITASELSAAGLIGNRQITALALNIITKASTSAYNGFTIAMANTNTANLNSGLISPTLTQVYSNNYTVPGTGWQTITFSTPFIWDGSSNILIQTCFDNGNSTSGIDAVQGTLTPIASGTRATAINATNAGVTAGCSLTGGGVSDSRPQFRFTQAIAQTPIETVLNSTKSFYLGPNSDVYLYSSADGELIARIQNLSSHDYGCTTIDIDRAGTSSVQFWNTTTANYLMDKTFHIVPTNNNSSGQYTVTFYFSASEVNGWETATGQLWSNIQLIKVPSQISNVTPATPEPDGAGTVQVVTPTLGSLGSAYTMTYTFSNGFSGFGAGIPGAQGTLPVELLSFTGKLQGENSKLDWSTASEYNSKGFDIEKSYDGINFKKIGFVASAGNSNVIRNYTFTDTQKAIERNYYRLKLVDIDNSFDYSDVVLVKNAFGKQGVYLAGNPFTDKINVQFAKTPNSKVGVKVYDMKGSKIYEKSYSNFDQTSLQINLGNQIARGIYSVKIETGGTVYNLKAIK